MSFISQVFSYASPGVRPYMQDVVHDKRNSAGTRAFAVCDGHGTDGNDDNEDGKNHGLQAAELVADSLLHHLCKDNVAPGRPMTYPLTESYVSRVCEHVQKKLVKEMPQVAADSGTTATVAICARDRNGKKLVQTVNVGDSRVIACVGGLPLIMTQDHKPELIGERKRLLQISNEPTYLSTNGDVRTRQGDMTVSRSFGDLDGGEMIIQEPDFRTWTVTKDWQFILLSSDGLWERTPTIIVDPDEEPGPFVGPFVIDERIVCEFIQCHLAGEDVSQFQIIGKYPTEETIKSENIAHKLVQWVIANGSQDNVSATIVVLTE